MTITIQVEVWTILIVTVMLCVLVVFLGNKIKKSDPAKKPEGAANVGLLLVQFIDGMVHDNMDESYVKHLGPVIGTIGLYILCSNLISLIGLPNPTANYSVTLTLALCAWVIIEGTQIKVKHVGPFLKGFLDPFFLFLPINIFGELSPILSMSMRLFGNILVGGILMELVYNATSLLSGLVPVIGQINFMGPVLAPALHAYFDVFAGVLQTYIFIMLTTVLAKSKSE